MPRGVRNILTFLYALVPKYIFFQDPIGERVETNFINLSYWGYTSFIRALILSESKIGEMYVLYIIFIHLYSFLFINYIPY